MSASASSPIPAFVGLKDLNAIKNATQPAANDTYTDKDGYTATREQFMFDRNAVLLLGEGGDAKFVSPPVGFTEDTKTALKSLFLLLLDHTGIPESVWGAELGSARATADTQQSQFVKEVQSWRMDAGGWIVRLCKIWLQTRALTDPQIWPGRLALEWPPLVQEDRELRLKYVEAARREADWLRSSVDELEKLHPIEGEEEELAERRSMMMKAERMVSSEPMIGNRLRPVLENTATWTSANTPATVAMITSVRRRSKVVTYRPA